MPSLVSAVVWAFIIPDICHALGCPPKSLHCSPFTRCSLCSSCLFSSTRLVSLSSIASLILLLQLCFPRPCKWQLSLFYHLSCFCSLPPIILLLFCSIWSFVSANTSVMFATAAPVSKHSSVFINGITISHNNKPSQEIPHQRPSVILGPVILHGETQKSLKRNYSDHFYVWINSVNHLL